MEHLQKINDYYELLKETCDKIDRCEIERAIHELLRARDEGNFIYIMGNGGSATTATHFAGDFVKGLSYCREKRYKFICLNDNPAALLALANDVSYESAFYEQLRNFLASGDVVIGISGSGNSGNVIKAVEYAKAQGNTVIGLTGYDGGKLMPLSDIKLHIPVDNMQIVEDLHLVFDHLIMSILYKLD